MKNKRVYCIIGEKYISQGLQFINSSNFNPPMAYDALSIKNTVNILEKFEYQIKFINYYDFKDKEFKQDDLFVITQYILNRFDDTKDVINDIKRKVNLLVESGHHFLLMHHFWPYYIFKDVLDIDYYKGKNQDWFQNKFDLKILNSHPTLINLDTFIRYNSTTLGSDEFTFMFKQKSRFETLIQKIPKSKTPTNFISFGYQQNNKSYIFLIDVHNIGSENTHAFYFDMVLNNTLNFLEDK